MALPWQAAKDPDEVKDYSLDWTTMLDGDTIATSTWTLVSGTGLTVGATSNTTVATKVWLSAGTDGQDYDLRNRITTAGGRTYDQTMTLRIRSK